MLVLSNGTETGMFRRNLLTLPQQLRCAPRMERNVGVVSENLTAGQHIWQEVDKADKLIENPACLLCLRALL